MLNRVGLRSAAMHSDRDQSHRERTLADFKEGRIPILVATDVASRYSVPLFQFIEHFKKLRLQKNSRAFFAPKLNASGFFRLCQTNVICRNLLSLFIL